MECSPLEQEPRLRLSRVYPASAEKIWQAWTDPQALSRWFGPGEPDSVTHARMDVRVGGRYEIAFRTQDGLEHQVSGVYQEVLPQRRLVFSWAWQSTPERVSLVTVELEPAGAGCALRFLHERFFDRDASDSHARGWTATFEKLGSLLG
ncbi:MAG: SRPBCC domain-containing protein [Ramlibacter sp.]